MRAEVEAYWELIEAYGRWGLKHIWKLNLKHNGSWIWDTTGAGFGAHWELDLKHIIGEF